LLVLLSSREGFGLVRDFAAFYDAKAGGTAPTAPNASTEAAGMGP
jgi:hypothetical protein